MKIHEPEFTEVCRDLTGAEGPIFSRNGQFCMVAPFGNRDSSERGDVVSVDLNTGKSEVRCSPLINSTGGVPAGCQFDKEGNLYVADMKLGILKINHDSSYTQVATKDLDGAAMQGCNDCIFDSEGNLWVTAPASEIHVLPHRRSHTEPFGSVYCMNKSGEVTKIDTGFLFPNGIAVQDDEHGKPSKLIVAETETKTLWEYDIRGAGKVENKKAWVKLPGDHEGGPDGMDFDAEGNLLVAHWNSGYIDVVTKNGIHEARIKCPFQKVSNLDFKPGTKEVYVTEHDNNALWKFTWRNEGKLHYSHL